MFEELDRSEPEKRGEGVTIGEALGVYALVLCVAFGSFIAFISLEDYPFGIQIASVIAYSGVVYVYAFFRTRGINTKHSLGDFYVQRVLPRLLAIHGGYLAVLCAGESIAIWIRNGLSPWWTTSSDQRGMPPITFVQFLVFAAMAISEIWLCRTLLAKSKKECSDESESDE